MAIVAKVGVPTPEGIFPTAVYHPYGDSLLRSNGQLCWRSSSFVEFLESFEEPETLYIAMECRTRAAEC